MVLPNMKYIAMCKFGINRTGVGYIMFVHNISIYIYCQQNVLEIINDILEFCCHYCSVCSIIQGLCTCSLFKTKNILLRNYYFIDMLL